MAGGAVLAFGHFGHLTAGGAGPQRLGRFDGGNMAQSQFSQLGQVEAVNETGVLDGYDPEIESVVTIPQVRRELLVRVDKIIRFSQGPHSDLEE